MYITTAIIILLLHRIGTFWTFFLLFFFYKVIISFTLKHNFYVSFREIRISCMSAAPVSVLSLQPSSSDRKSLQGLSPHHRWPFNTSLATANEAGVAAAWLDLDDFAQMFISRSPAVLGEEVPLKRWINLKFVFLFALHRQLTFQTRCEGFWQSRPGMLLRYRNAGAVRIRWAFFFFYILQILFLSINLLLPRWNLKQPYLLCTAALASRCVCSGAGDKTAKAQLTS